MPLILEPSPGRDAQTGSGAGAPAPGASADPAAVARRGPTLLFEQRLWLRGCALVAGVDEVGRGPLAGPVVAAAVILPPDLDRDALRRCDDSKRLPPGVREALAPRIRAAATATALAVVESEEIDRLNILQASAEAMCRAIALLVPAPGHALIDGLRNGRLRLPQTPLVGGDGLSLSIAAASVLAKVHRDALMVAAEAAYPGYGFAEHKGYPTAQHRQALRRLGPCPLHRRSFRLD